MEEGARVGPVGLERIGPQKSRTSWWVRVGELGEEEGGVMDAIFSDLVGLWYFGLACACVCVCVLGLL